MLDAQWPFVERDNELQTFDEAWTVRSCRVVAIFGPAGVGKSRLADELLMRAVDGGRRPVRVTANAASATVPLSAIAHLIPSGVDFSDPVAGFVEIARRLAGDQGDRQWAVLVEDLHLLDAASAALLRHLLDAGVARLIATVRTGERDSAAVQALAWGEAVGRIDLAPFDQDSVGRLLRVALDAPISRRAAHRLFEASGGNALYLRELVRGGLDAGALTFDGEIWELGDGAPAATVRLLELIGSRLAAVSPAGRRVLDLLALCEPVSLADAAATASLGVPASSDVASLDVAAATASFAVVGPSSLDVVAELEQRGLVAIRTDGRRTHVVLGHPLYGEVLCEELPVARRRALLLAHIERFQAHGGRRRDDALHLARWSLAATGTADPGLLHRAAVLARHAHDYEQAVALLGAMAGPDRTYASCFLHGDALAQLGHWADADAMLDEAQRRAGSEKERVGATLVRTWNLFWIAARTDEAFEVNDAALREVSTPEGKRILVLNESSMMTLSGRPHQGLALLDDLETSVDDVTDLNSWIGAAMSKSAGLAYVGRSHEAVAWGWTAYAEQVKVDEQTLGPAHPVAQLVPVIFAATDAGDLAEAVRVADRILTELIDHDGVQTRVWAATYRGRAEWLAGNGRAARRWYAEAIAQGQRHRQIRPLFQAWAGLAAAAAILGDFDTAEAALVQMRTNPVMGHQAGEERLGEAWLHAAHGRLAQARKVLTEAAEAARITGQRTSEMLILTDLARLGGAAEAAPRLDELGRHCEGAFAPARVAFATALAADDPDGLMTAADQLSAIGAHLLAAEAAATASAAWRRAGSQRRATSAAHAARASAARCPGARTPLLAGIEVTWPLTSREREIALLAAGNLRSKEIAETLHLSVRTVDNHLQRAYAKLGVATRRELAEALKLTQ